MDQIQNQKLPNDAKVDEYHFLRRTLQVVLSLFILSLFFCYSHGVSFFPYSFSVYFSTCLFSLFTHTLERKYMFLICNGILAILAKTSVSGGSNYHDVSYSDETTVQGSELSVDKTRSAAVIAEDQVEYYSSVGAGFVDEEEQEQEQEQETIEDEEQGRSYEALSGSGTSSADENENQEEDQEIGSGSEFSSKKEANINDEDQLISTDELNKKIEEFIRKMKEEIRIEAQQQQLIAV